MEELEAQALMIALLFINVFLLLIMVIRKR